MRFFLILLVALLGVWLWRSNREEKSRLKEQKPRAAPAPLQTVACSLCAVHVPALEAVQGKKGAYCCLEHRQRAEP
ncbi:PP0621 family protein [Rhodoferax sp.]|uniref:PP0621 family protein n=1 Tax=Rhodoferax sp. TaxID=50421 RepID=UPI003448432D